MTTFSVYGTATLSSPAERALVRVTATATGDDRATLAHDVGRAHDALLAGMAELGDDGPSHSSGSVVTDTVVEYPQSGDPILRHRARVSTDVVFTGFERLGDLVGDWAATELLEIDWLRWELHETTQRTLTRQARIEAVQDATQRAADYASALGAPTPVLERLFEEGLRSGDSGGGGAFARKAMMMDAPSGGGPSFDLTPPSIDVTVTLSADFSG